MKFNLTLLAGFILTLLTTNQSISQTRWFEESVIDSDFAGAFSVASGDLDGDGIEDPIAAGLDCHQLAWWSRDEVGSWIKHIIDAPVNNVSLIIVRDLDGDNDSDLVVTSVRDNSLIWYENDGRAAFNRHLITSDFPGAINAAVADFNGDGHLDIIAAAYHGDEVAIWLNNGNQSFTEQVIASNLNGPYQVVPIDFDGDGDLDVIVPLFDGNGVVWLENDGELNFTAHTLSDQIPGCSSVAVFDYEGDGDLDILASSYYNNQLMLLRHDPDGAFALVQPSLLYNYYDGWLVKSTDLNGDGTLDIFTCDPTNRSLRWWLNQGNGNFEYRQRVIGAMGDFSMLNSDGNETLQIVASLPGEGEIILLRQNDWVSHSFPRGQAWNPKSPRAGDLDGDGDLDFVTGSFDGYALYWVNDGGGNFEQHVLYDAHPQANDLQLADIDGDGDLDIAIALYSGYMIWLENLGNWQFTPHRVDAPEGTHPWGRFYYCCPTDLNGDGRLDLLYCNNDGAFVWSENLGGNQFNLQIRELHTYGRGVWVGTGDFNGDGLPDIVGLQYLAPWIYFWINNGDTTFTASLINDEGTNGISAKIVDLDGDGNLDILTTGKNGINLFRNDGRANFTITPLITDSLFHNDIEAVDVDGDGDLDLVTDAGNEVQWWINDGESNFKKTVVRGVEWGSSLAAVGDYNNDGIMGIVSADLDRQTLNYSSYQPYVRSFPPMPFDLISPEDQVILAPGSTTFSWQASNDSDRWDTPTYRILFQNADTTVSIPTGFAREYNLFPDLIGLGTGQFIWWVEAQSQHPFISVRSRQRRSATPNGVNKGSSQNTPADYILDQNFPNPFNGQTTIRFGMPRAGQVSIEVDDITGRRVQTLIHSNLAAGWHSVNFDANDLADGIYFLRLVTPERSLTIKSLLIK